MATSGIIALPQQAFAVDSDVVAVRGLLGEFEETSRQLVMLGRLAGGVPGLPLAFGGPDGAGFGDLLERAVDQRLTTVEHFDDLDDALDTSTPLSLGDGREATVAATVSPPASGTTVKTLSVSVSVQRDVTAPLDLRSETPKVVLSSPDGVRMDLRAGLSFTVGYDTADQSVSLLADPAPAVTVDATGELDGSVEAAAGVLGITLTTPTENPLAVGVHLRGTLTDPDGDGRLAYSVPSGSGPVPGDLETAGSLGELLTVGFDPAQRSSLAGTLNITASGTGIPGLDLSGLAASVTVQDDLADSLPAAVTANGFDATLEQFQSLSTKDLAGGLGQLVTTIRAFLMARGGTASDTLGDVDLPFLRGRLSDAVQTEAALREFLRRFVPQAPTPDPDAPAQTPDQLAQAGIPQFANLQHMLRLLDETTGLVPGGGIDVVSSAYDAAGKRVSFDLRLHRSGTAESLDPQPVDTDPGDGVTPPKAGVGAVQLGDLVASRAGVTGLNAGTATDGSLISTAQVTPSYDARLGVVIDLTPPRTGDGCRNYLGNSDQPCPFTRTDNGVSSVVTELPLPTDRFALARDRTSLVADAPITSTVTASGAAGFVQVAATGNISLTKPASAGHMLEVRLNPALPEVVPLAEVFRLLVADPFSTASNDPGLLAVDTAVQAQASLRLSVPGAPAVLGDDGLAVTLTMADATNPSGVTVATDADALAAKLRALVVPSGDPAQLLGQVLRALQQLRDGLQAAGADVPLLDTPLPVLGTSLGALLDSDELDLAISALAGEPATTLQDVVARLNDELGPQSPLTFDVDATNRRLLLNLAYDDVYQRDVPLSAALGDAVSGIGSLASDGRVRLAGTFSGDLRLALPLADATAQPLVLPGSGLRLTTDVGIDDLRLRGTLGPLSLLIGTEQDPGQLRARYTASLAKADHTSAVPFAEWLGNLALTLNSDAARTASCGGDTAQLDLALCGSVTLYTQVANGTPQEVGDLALLLPREDPFNLAGKVRTSGAGSDRDRVVVPDNLDERVRDAVLQLFDLSGGITGVLDDVATGLDLASAEGRTPLIGEKLQALSRDVRALRAQVEQATQSLPALQGDLTYGQVEDQLTAALDPVALGDGAAIVVRGTCETAGVTLACAEDDGVASIRDVNVVFDVGGTISEAVPLNLGIPGLRLRGLPAGDAPTTSGAAADVTLAASWAVRVAVGLSRTEGVYVLTESDGSDAGDLPDGPELRLSASVDLPAVLEANLGFIRVTATDENPSTAKALDGSLTVDLAAAGGGARLTLGELLAGGATVDPRLSATLDVDWALQATIGPENALPGIGADLDINWAWSNQAPMTTSPTIAFTDVRVDLGQFVENALGPVVQQVAGVLAPAKPVIETLQARLPVLSDLSNLAGGGDISLLTIAQAYSTIGGDARVTAVLKVVEIIKIVQQVSEAAATGSIPLGAFQVDGSQAKADEVSGDLVSALTVNEDPQPTEAREDAFRTGTATSGTNVLDIMTHEAKGGFSFPLLSEPMSGFDLLLGKDVDLVRYDMGELRLQFAYRQSFGPVFPVPPVFITIGGAARIDAHIALGFDTYGLRTSFEQGLEPGGIAVSGIRDGLFISDLRDGREVPEVALVGELTAGAQVNVGIAAAGAEGGIRLTVSLDLRDPDRDGKVRFLEIRDQAYNFFCVFDVAGALDAFLRAYLTVGIGPLSKTFDFELANVRLLDFSSSCPPLPPTPPVVASVVGDALVVHTGANGRDAQRSAPWGNDHASGPHTGKPETVVVTELRNSDSGAYEGFGVQMLGQDVAFLTAQYPGLNRVVVDQRGYAPKLTATFLSAGVGTTGGVQPFDKAVLVLGGTGNDVVKAEAATVTVAVDGGGGNDNIATGSGADIVAGGTGGDAVMSGLGGDKVTGDGSLVVSGTAPAFTAAWSADPQAAPAEAGADRLNVGAGQDEAYGGPGADVLDAGADAADITGGGDAAGDLLVGGPAGDTIRGGSGADTVYGDEEDAALGEDAEGDAAGGDDTIDTGRGGDVVRAGAGSDVVVSRGLAGDVARLFGNGGPDRLTGGAGNDLAYGGPGDDDLVGGLGGDRLEGGAAADHLIGDRGQVTYPGGVRTDAPAPDGTADGSDTLLGEAGADVGYGQGGDDLLVGDGQSSPCTGRDPRDWTSPAEPAVTDAGADRLSGGAGADDVAGDAGGDRLDGGGDVDVVCGGDGADTARGGDGRDAVWGGSGDDPLLSGDGGDDRVYAGTGADTAFGGAGDDHVEGGPGDDSAHGEGGDDRVQGGSTGAVEDTGDTHLTGGTGADVVVGDDGALADAPSRQVDLLGLTGPASLGGGDLLDGGSEDDLVLGGPGDDRAYGGGHDDRVEGGPGADRAFGETGQDDVLGGSSSIATAGTAVPGLPDEGDLLLDGGDGHDVVLGDNGEVVRGPVDGSDPEAPERISRDVELRDLGTAGSSGGDLAHGSTGHDLVLTGDGNDVADLGPGNDEAELGAGALDTALGGSGQDDMIGGSSPAYLPAGTTTTVVGDARDEIDGGDGADVVLGDNGSVTHRLSGPTWHVSEANGAFVRQVLLLDRTGTGAADALRGGRNDDLVWGEVGDDELFGDEDDDLLEGGIGADVLEGGTGDDDLVGGTTPYAVEGGDDAAAGSADGDDRLYGLSSDRARLTSLSDDDVLLGDNARVDRCEAGGRDDCTWTRLELGVDPDGAPLGRPRVRFVTLLGEATGAQPSDGDDRLFGGPREDVLYGEDGEDLLHGDAGQDRLYGGHDADQVFGDAGHDGALGDRGLLEPVRNGAPGTPAEQRIETRGPPNLAETVHVVGTLWWRTVLHDQDVGGDDDVFGGQGDDALHGGAGSDYVTGDDGPHVAGTPAAAGGADAVFGGEGQDSLTGGPGRDHLYGGHGEDDLDVARGLQAAPKVGRLRYPTLQDFANRYGGAYDSDPGAQGADLVLGGFDRDLLQADDNLDRLVDAAGAYNLFFVCPAAYGGEQITRALSPDVRSFFEQLAEADGAIGAAARSGTGAREAAIIYPGPAPDNAGSAYPTTPGHFTCV